MRKLMIMIQRRRGVFFRLHLKKSRLLCLFAYLLEKMLKDIQYQYAFLNILPFQAITYITSHILGKDFRHDHMEVPNMELLLCYHFGKSNQCTEC